MGIAIPQLVNISTGATGLLKKILSGGSGGFESIFKACFSKLRGTQDTGNNFFSLLSRKVSGNKEDINKVLASGAGIYLFHLIAMMKNIGMNHSDLTELFRGNTKGISDNALKSMMQTLGFNDREVSAVFSDNTLKNDIKNKVFNELYSNLMKQCSKSGIDMDSMIGIIDNNGGNLDELISSLLPDRLQKDSITDGLENEIKGIVSKALTDKAGQIDISSENTKLDNMMETLTSSVGIDKKDLKNIFFETIPQKRAAAVDRISKKISAFLKVNEGKQMPSGMMDALELIRSVTNDKEWAKVDHVIKIWYPGLSIGDAPITMDKAVFMTLAAKVSDDPSSFLNKDVAHVMDQLRTSIPLHIKNGDGRVSLKLYPPMLGKVDVHLSLHDGKLQAVFNTDRALTHNILQQHMPLLREVLANQGIRIHHFSVNMGFDSRDAHSGNAFGFLNQNRSDRGSSYRYPHHADEPSRADYYMDEDGRYRYTDGLDIFA